MHVCYDDLMDDFGALVLIMMLFFYGAAATVVAIVALVSLHSKKKKLDLSQRTIDALRRQIAEMNRDAKAKPAAPVQTPKVLPQVQRPVQQPAPQPVQRPAVQPAPAVQRPVAAVQQPAPVARPTPAPKPKEKIKFSSINISFAVGVLLITIVGAVFISSSWGFMNDALRAGVLIGAVALVFFLSYLSGKILKLKQTGFAFYTLGSLLLPVVTCGIGAMELFGEWFSFNGDGAAIVAACAALLFGTAGFVGVKIYKSGAYYGIMYLGFTWTLLFVAAQFGYKYYDRVGCCFLALSAAAFAASFFARKPQSENIKFFKLYSEIITYVSLGAILFVVWNFDYIPVIIGLGFVIANLLAGEKKWMSYVTPVVMFVFSLYAASFTEYDYNDGTYPLLVYALCVTIFFVLLKAIKKDTIVSDLLLSFFLVGGIFAGRIEYRPEIAAYVSTYYVTLGVIFFATVVSGYCAFRKGQHKAVSGILSVVSALTLTTFVYSAGSYIFFGDSLGKALDEVSAILGIPLDLSTYSLHAASAMAYTAALSAYILCNYFRKKHPSLRFSSYGFMFAAFVCAIPTLGGHMMYLAICTSAIVRTVRMCFTEKETATKVSRVLSAISHYTAMALMVAVFGKSASVIYMLCLLIVFAGTYIRVVFGGSKWQRYITPAIASFISVYASTFANRASVYNVETELAVFGLCLLAFCLFSEITKLRNAVTDIIYPVIFFLAALSGSVVYHEDLWIRFVVTAVFITTSVILLSVCAFRKDSHKVVRIVALMAGGIFSSTLFYSVGTCIFFDRNGALPLVFGGALALVCYIFCAIVVPKLKGNPMAAWASYSYYACSIFMLSKALDTTISISTAASALLLLAALAAIFSRFFARPSRHPDIRACAALVFALFAATLLICSAFKEEVYQLVGIGFYLAVIAVSLIPQIRSHEVIGKYIAVADIASCLIGSRYFAGNEYFDSNPWLGVVAAVLLVALLYLKKNTVVAIFPILVSMNYIVEAISSVEGYYVIYCAIGIVLIGLGLLLHKKAYSAPLYLDYLTYVAILFPLNLFSADGFFEARPFAIFLTIALILVSHAIRYPKAKAVLLSISASFMCLAILSLEFIREIPDIVRGEVVMVLILLDVFLIRYVIKPGKESTMRVFWIITVSVCLAIEGLSAAATGEILDLLITGIVSVAIFIYAFIAKDKSWFLLSVIAIIAIAVYLSATFWASKAWLVYLLVVGVILISMAAINEYGKRKAELAGEQTEGQGAGVKRFFEEWKW